jgi:hypothetical protein
MSGKTELKEMRLQKELLVLQSDTSRLLLDLELQRLRSPEFWRREAGQAVRTHPWLTAVIGAGTGVLAINAIRQRGSTLKWLGRLGGAGTTLLSVWKMFSRK